MLKVIILTGLLVVAWSYRAPLLSPLQLPRIVSSTNRFNLQSNLNIKQSSIARIIRSSPANELFSSLNSEYIVDGIPVQSKFETFFNKFAVQPSTNTSAPKVITLDNLLEYQVIQDLLTKGSVKMDDINDLWSSFAIDSDTLEFTDAYDLVCMVYDLPDPDDEKYFVRAYKKLSGKSSGVSFDKLIDWKDINVMLEEKIFDIKDIQDAWNAISDPNAEYKNLLNLEEFIRINYYFDDLVDAKVKEETANAEKIIDAWSDDFEPEEYLNKDVVGNLKSVYESLADPKTNLLSKENFLKWNLITEILTSKLIPIEDITMLWNEAVAAFTGFDANDAPTMTIISDIDYHTFLCLNIRIDQYVDNMPE